MYPWLFIRSKKITEGLCAFYLAGDLFLALFTLIFNLEGGGLVSFVRQNFILLFRAGYFFLI